MTSATVQPPDSAAAMLDEETPSSVSLQTGIDIQSIQAFKTMDDETFAAIKRRSFTTAERSYCEQTGKPAQHYAARWAAKEAFRKCIDDPVPFATVGVTRSDSRPALSLAPRAKRVLSETLGTSQWTTALSLTHDSAADAAVAQLLVAGDHE